MDRAKEEAVSDQEEYGGHANLTVTSGGASTWTVGGSCVVAQHTYTPSCDGLHGPGPCPERERPVAVTSSGGLRLSGFGGSNG